MGNTEKTILQVNMFGGLAITYEGKNVSIGKNKTAKYIQLLEIVWLAGDAGIQKDQLTGILYDREEQSNLNNSFNNLIYQMHKQLKKSGLPDCGIEANPPHSLACHRLQNSLHASSPPLAKPYRQLKG